MHEALLKRVQTALALAILDCNQTYAELFSDVAGALSILKGAPDLAVIEATTPTSMADGPGHHFADRLMLPLQLELQGTTGLARRDFWRDLFTGLVGFAEGDIGEADAAALMWTQAFACCPPPTPPTGLPSAQQGGKGVGRAEGRGTAESLKQIISPAGGALRKGAGEQVKASGLTAEGKEAACGRKVVIHQMTGGSADYLNDPTGNRRFWPLGEEVNSSGLAAEGDDAAACSTMPGAAADNAIKGEPGAAT